MTTTQIIVLVVVVLVLLAAIAAYMAAQKKRRSEELRSTFGSEYDRTLDSSGRRRDAEKDLAARAEHRSSLDIRPLSEADRQAFAARWTQTQADFVDRPAEAVKSADNLVTEVMRERGYPVGDFDQQARDVSVDHAEVVHEYRAAHDISLLNDRQQATTEQLRQAMVHYRTLFSELLGHGDVAQAAPPVYPTEAGHRSERDLSGRDDMDRGTTDRSLDDRDTTIGTSGVHRADDREMPADSRMDDRAEARFAANHDGPYGDDSASRAGQDAGYDTGRDDAYDGPRDGTLSGGASDPGYATDEDRRVREGGLLASGREQDKVVHVRRERLEGDSDRDLPPRS
jgi:hypothetical protein